MKKKGWTKHGKYQLWVPGIVGRTQVSTRTSDRVLAGRIQRMVLQLKDEQDWQLLDAIRSGVFTLPEIYSAWTMNRVPELRARINDVILSGHLDPWVAWVLGNGQRRQTVDTYRAQVTTLISPGFPLSNFSRKTISEWLSGLQDVTTGTKRKYLAALKSFVRYLLEREIIEVDPTSGVKSPKKNDPRERWETQATDQRIVEAAMPEYRSLFAFIKATGAEVSAALGSTRNDIDIALGLAHVHGTKNAKRNRKDVIIEQWAMSYLRDHCRSAIGNVPLWPTIDRYQAHRHHQATCVALNIDDYTLRDSRHSWAVRARKRGETFEAIAEQLGNSVAMVVQVYAKFKPELEERTTRRDVLGL